MGGKKGEESKLRSCYKKSLKLAKENNIKSVSFPLISTGGFGYPIEEGMRIAVDEINAFLLSNNMDIYLVVFDTKATRLGEKLYSDLEAYIDHNYVKIMMEQEYSLARPTIGVSMKAPQMLLENCDMADFDVSFDFEEKHERKLEERMRHRSDTFSEYLIYLIKVKNMENSEVWKRAIVDKKVFSKIKNNPNYHPKKITALCLCIGAKLNLDESKDLLARAGYALSPCDKTDIIFSYFIENEIYDMIELDIQLEEHGLPCIIS
jgi:hypothetical protein